MLKTIKYVLKRLRMSVQYTNDHVVLTDAQRRRFECLRVALFKDFWPDETVHVLASGPSLNSAPLYKLKGERKVYVNGAIRVCQEAGAVFVVCDPRFVRHQPDLWIELTGLVCFLTTEVIQAIDEQYPAFLKVNQIVLIHNTNDRMLRHPSIRWRDEQVFLSDKNDKIGMSLDLAQGFFEAGTVTFAAAQLANYMGVRQIVIHGMDVLNAHEPRFYESQSHQAPSRILEGKDRIISSFDFLASQFAKRGVLLQNASPISKDVFEMVAFDWDGLSG